MVGVCAVPVDRAAISFEVLGEVAHLALPHVALTEWTLKFDCFHIRHSDTLSLARDGDYRGGFALATAVTLKNDDQ